MQNGTTKTGGHKGKGTLSEEKLNITKTYVFGLHPMGKAQEKLTWAICKTVIIQAIKRNTEMAQKKQAATEWTPDCLQK